MATAVGVPEASAFVDKLIDRGLSSLQKRGEAAIDEPKRRDRWTSRAASAVTQ